MQSSGQLESLPQKIVKFWHYQHTVWVRYLRKHIYTHNIVFVNENEDDIIISYSLTLTITPTPTGLHNVTYFSSHNIIDKSYIKLTWAICSSDTYSPQGGIVTCIHLHTSFYTKMTIHCFNAAACNTFLNTQLYITHCWNFMLHFIPSLHATVQIKSG